MNRRLFTTFAVLFVSVSAVAAESGVEFQQLSFGRLLILDNSAVRSCTITALGSETCDGSGVALLNPGQVGVYRLSGFDPNTQVSAIIDQNTPLANTQDGALLDVSNFTFDPPIDITPQTPDASGKMTLKIGAMLSTRAGVTYPNVPFHGTYRLTITF